ncbi:MAG: hypothetical protein AAGJ18_26355 [Bacteroidota bacterium]
MNNRKLVLGAFWIDGTDKYFFGLRDAKNYQKLHGGDIRGPHGKLIKADPARDAKNLTSDNRMAAADVSLNKEIVDSSVGSSNHGKKVMGKSSAAEKIPTTKKKSGGLFSFFKKK